jgi:hypothetical protein
VSTLAALTVATAVRAMKTAENFILVSESGGQVAEDASEGKSRLLNSSRFPNDIAEPVQI